jgi:mono/diheme cytochrome c family protein
MFRASGGHRVPLDRSLVTLLAVAGLLGCSARSDHDVRDGAELYRVHCASCHGADARGKGPVAPILAVEVPDLTRIAARHQGTFPREEIFKAIDGQSGLVAHGPRHMPVWGYEFFGSGSDDELAHGQATERIEQLVAYLGTLQRPN